MRLTSPLALAALAAPLLLAPAALSQGELLPISRDRELLELAESWETLAELFDVPGAAVAIIKDGNTYVWTYGQRHPETGDPVTPDTMFYIASITKTYTASAIVKLAEEGQLNLSDPITKFLPALKLGDGVQASSVTVEDLITHAKGINSTPVVILDAYSGGITNERYDHWLERGTVAGATEYTNVNLTLAGRIIEAVTGTAWRDYLDQHFFTPAGMTRTTGYASEIYTDENTAFPTVWDGQNWVVATQMKTDRTMHAAGGLGTTARDAATWLTLQLTHGTLTTDNGTTQILTPESIDPMHRLQSALDEPSGTIRISDGFGYGWNVGSFASRAPLSSHGGGYVGTSAWFGVLPNHDAAVAVLTNGDGSTSGWGSIVAVETLTHITGIEPEWSPRENFSARVTQMKEDGELPRAAVGLSTVSTHNLTRPLELYTGRFHNPHLGTLTVTRVGTELSIKLGDYTADAAPAAQPDTLDLADNIEDNGTLEFIVGPLGYVDQIRLSDDSLGTLVFAR